MKIESLATYYDALTTDKAKRRGINDFGLSLRAAIRGLWSGSLSLFDFTETMISNLERSFEVAWQEGAATCGVLPDERSSNENDRLSQYTNDQIQYILPFGQEIQENSKANGGLLRPQLTRSKIWLNRYNEVFSIAQQMACADQKLVWRIGATEKHCKTCLKLNGRVMRASKWQELDIHPQDIRPGKLDCNGFN